MKASTARCSGRRNSHRKSLLAPAPCSLVPRKAYSTKCYALMMAGISIMMASPALIAATATATVSQASVAISQRRARWSSLWEGLYGSTPSTETGCSISLSTGDQISRPRHSLREAWRNYPSWSLISPSEWRLYNKARRAAPPSLSQYRLATVEGMVKGLQLAHRPRHRNTTQFNITILAFESGSGLMSTNSYQMGHTNACP